MIEPLSLLFFCYNIQLALLLPNIYVLWFAPCAWFTSYVRIANFIRNSLLAAVFANQISHALTLLPLNLLTSVKRAINLITSAPLFSRASIQEDDNLEEKKEEKLSFWDDKQRKIDTGIDLSWKYYAFTV